MSHDSGACCFTHFVILKISDMKLMKSRARMGEGYWRNTTMVAG